MLPTYYSKRDTCQTAAKQRVDMSGNVRQPLTLDQINSQVYFKTASANQSGEQRRSISRLGYKIFFGSFLAYLRVRNRSLSKRLLSDFNKCNLLLLIVTLFPGSPSSLPHLFAYGPDTTGCRTSDARLKAATKGLLMFLYQQFASGLDTQTSSTADELTYRSMP